MRVADAPLNAKRSACELLDLPGLTAGGLERGVVEGCTHHLGHAGRPVEQVEEGLLGDVVQVHVSLSGLLAQSTSQRSAI